MLGHHFDITEHCYTCGMARWKALDTLTACGGKIGPRELAALARMKENANAPKNRPCEPPTSPQAIEHT